MRDLDAETITAAVVDSLEGADDERLRHLLEALAKHLHGFAREVRLTHAEWRAVGEFLFRCGKISSETRNEFFLLSDVLGLTSLVDILNEHPDATVGSPLGPFYAAGSPYVAPGADLARDNAGEVYLLAGRVTDPQSRPIAGAELDIWQTNAAGLYATQDPSQHPDNLRCRQICDEEGRYSVTTIRPAPYTVPTDGPVGGLMEALHRSPWRAAHVHLIARAEGYRPIITEVFFSDDPLIGSDAVFGVRRALVATPVDVDADDLPPLQNRRPTKRVDFDVVLVPEEPSAPPASGLQHGGRGNAP